MVKLIAWLYVPTEGTIELDGLDYIAIKVSDLRSKMSFTFQDFAKYYMTIEDNIKFSDLENHTHKDVSRFAQMNDTDEFINALPEGYQQRLGRMFNKSTD